MFIVRNMTIVKENDFLAGREGTEVDDEMKLLEAANEARGPPARTFKRGNSG